MFLVLYAGWIFEVQTTSRRAGQVGKRWLLAAPYQATCPRRNIIGLCRRGSEGSDQAATWLVHCALIFQPNSLQWSHVAITQTHANTGPLSAMAAACFSFRRHRTAPAIPASNCLDGVWIIAFVCALPRESLATAGQDRPCISMDLSVPWK